MSRQNLLTARRRLTRLAERARMVNERQTAPAASSADEWAWACACWSHPLPDGAYRTLWWSPQMCIDWPQMVTLLHAIEDCWHDPQHLHPRGSLEDLQNEYNGIVTRAWQAGWRGQKGGATECEGPACEGPALAGEARDDARPSSPNAVGTHALPGASPEAGGARS